MKRQAGGFLTGKMKFASRDTTKGKAFNSVLFSKLKAGAIAGDKQASVIITHTAVNVRSDRIQDIFIGQIVSGAYFRPADCFGPSLFTHYFRTGIAQLNTCKGMNGVVDTKMAGDKTAEQATVGSIYNSIYPQSCNISPPYIQVFL
jgi:hypothetical protein